MWLKVLALATDDVAFLVAHLPGSNDILAAIAASPAQAVSVRGLPAEAALAWARGASGARREPYRTAGPDSLFQRLIEIEAPDEALWWRLLVEDDGTAPGALPWASYLALAARVRTETEARPLPTQSRLRSSCPT